MSLPLQERIFDLVKDEEPAKAVEALAETIAVFCSVYGGLENAIAAIRRMDRGIMGDVVRKSVKEN